MLGEYKIGKRGDPSNPAIILGIRGRKKRIGLLEDINCRGGRFLERKVKNMKTEADTKKKQPTKNFF